MTAEECAYTVYEQQGYLVVGSSSEFEIGITLHNPFTHVNPGDRMSVALKVIAKSTVQEFLDQASAGSKLMGIPVDGQPPYKYYYRTVPQD